MPCLFLSAGLSLFSPVAAATDCPSAHYDERVRVKQIIDGDTLQLADGRHLRLIGINTPERATRTRRAEPLAEEARRSLQSLVDTERPFRLRRGKEKQDRYGRLLAHLFNADGRNITASLLSAGMGAAIQIPPNLWGYTCYLEAENRARKQRRGIWQHPYFIPLEADRLGADTRGFHFVRGRLSRVGKSKTALWLNLGEDFALRIPEKAFPWFKSFPFDQLVGKQLTARGWIYRRKGQLRMNLYHPASLEINVRQ